MDRSTLEPPLDSEHGGDIFSWGRRLRLKPAEILDFSASINPLGPPPLAREAFVKSYRELSCYPDPCAEELKVALSARHEMEPQELLLGNGSTQLIYLTCRTFRPRRAVVVAPAFSEYANALKLAGAEVHFFFLAPGDHFRFTLEKFVAQWKAGHDIVFLATPNSATGQAVPKQEIEEIARIALRVKSLLVVDEAFIDFVERESVKELVRENPFVIVLRSLTKYYALPGLRLGYLFAQAQRVRQLAAHQEPWSVNGPAQRVALACLADTRFRSRTQEWLNRERGFLFEGLARLRGLQPYPSETNFVLVNIKKSGDTAVELRSFLLGRKILIRACDSFLGLGPDYFRVAVRLRGENKLLLKALKEFLGE